MYCTVQYGGNNTEAVVFPKACMPGTVPNSEQDRWYEQQHADCPHGETWVTRTSRETTWSILPTCIVTSIIGLPGRACHTFMVHDFLVSTTESSIACSSILPTWIIPSSICFPSRACHASMIHDFLVSTTSITCSILPTYIVTFTIGSTFWACHAGMTHDFLVDITC